MRKPHRKEASSAQREEYTIQRALPKRKLPQLLHDRAQ